MAARHPCEGLSRAQREAFEAIAVNQPPAASQRTLDALLRRGLIVKGEDQTQRDALGFYKIPTYYVPLPIHRAWCEWCSENVELPED